MSITKLSFSIEKRKPLPAPIPIHSERMMRNYHLLKRISKKKARTEIQSLKNIESHRTSYHQNFSSTQSKLNSGCGADMCRSMDLSCKKSNESLVLGVTIVNKVRMHSCIIGRGHSQYESWKSQKINQNKSQLIGKNSLELLIAKAIINPFDSKLKKTKRFKGSKFAFPKVVVQQS